MAFVDPAAVAYEIVHVKACPGFGQA